MSRYAISDLHGMLKLYQEVKKFLKPDDIVYCLGDCGDRGPQPWETIKAIASDKQFIYLKGNHEDMLVKAMQAYLRENDIDPTFGATFTLACNGGFDTLVEWVDDGAKTGWIHYLQNLPTHMEFTNEQGIEILLSHAGYTPFLHLPSNQDLVWDREHLIKRWPAGKDKILVVHGHTPIQLLEERVNRLPYLFFNEAPDPYKHGAYWYANNHKVDIDCGAYATNETVLFDLDTFDEHIFSVAKN